MTSEDMDKQFQSSLSKIQDQWKTLRDRYASLEEDQLAEVNRLSAEKAELQKSLKSIKNIENRLIKAEKKKEEVGVNQIKNLKEKLFPNNSLQERHDNLISILLFYGGGVIEDLIQNINPLEKEFTILS